MTQVKNTKSVEDLIAALEALEKPVFADNNREMLRGRVMMSVENRIGFGADLSMSAVQKAILKEKIFVRIEQDLEKKMFWNRFFSYSRRLVSASLLVFFSFSIFAFTTVNSPVVFADSFSQIDGVQGDVKLERAGTFMIPTQGMEVREGDKILTGNNGFVSVKFFDDSIARLNNDTELSLTKIAKVDRQVGSHVEVSLERGVVWSKVVNLVDEKSVFVVEADQVSAKAKRAAFNVSTNGEKVEVGVFNNMIDLNALGGSSKVVNGEKVVIEDANMRLESINPSEKDVAWVKGNLQSDKRYVAEVQQKNLLSKLETLGVSTEDDLNFESNSIAESTVLMLTFDDVKKKKVELDLAEKNFLIAQIRLNDPKISSEDKVLATNAIDEFSVSMKSFVALVQNVEKKDKDYADELDSYMNEKILVQKKSLSIITPDSPTYVAKRVIDEIELIAADTDKEKLEIKRQKTEDTLALAQDLFLDGKDDLAVQVVAEYKQTVEEVVEVAQNIGDADLLNEIDTVDRKILSSVVGAPAPVVVAPVNPVVPVTPVTSVTAVAEEPVEATSVETNYGLTLEGDKVLPPLLK